MSEKNFSVGGKDYQLRKINAFKQFHIVRRVAPILSEMLPSLSKIQAVGKSDLSESEKFDKFAELLSPIMIGLSKLSDKDADTVLLGLLEAVEVKQEIGNWAPVATGGNLMFADMELPVMLQLAGRAFAYNLSGFFATLQQVSPAQK